MACDVAEKVAATAVTVPWSSTQMTETVGSFETSAAKQHGDTFQRAANSINFRAFRYIYMKMIAYANTEGRPSLN
jgi:hypothetical protein